MDFLDPFGLLRPPVNVRVAALEEENNNLKDRIQELECQIADLEDYKWMYEELTS